jgi:hypothetical protein
MFENKVHGWERLVMHRKFHSEYLLGIKEDKDIPVTGRGDP